MAGQNVITEKIKTVAESFAGLSLVTFSVTFVGDTLLPKIVLVVFGALFALIWFYLVIPYSPGKETFLSKIMNQKTMSICKSFGWSIALAMFAVNLLLQDVSTFRIIGLILAILSYIVILWGIWSARNISE